MKQIPSKPRLYWNYVHIYYCYHGWSLRTLVIPFVRFSSPLFYCDTNFTTKHPNFMNEYTLFCITLKWIKFSNSFYLHHTILTHTDYYLMISFCKIFLKYYWTNSYSYCITNLFSYLFLDLFGFKNFTFYSYPVFTNELTKLFAHFMFPSVIFSLVHLCNFKSISFHILRNLFKYGKYDANIAETCA